MNRRGFLRLVGVGVPAAAIAPFVPMPEFASGGLVNKRLPQGLPLEVMSITPREKVLVYVDDGRYGGQGGGSAGGYAGGYGGGGGGGDARFVDIEFVRRPDLA